MTVAELLAVLEGIEDKCMEVRAILNYHFDTGVVNRGIHAVYQYDKSLWLSEETRIEEDMGVGSLVFFEEPDKV